MLLRGPGFSGGVSSTDSPVNSESKYRVSVSDVTWGLNGGGIWKQSGVITNVWITYPLNINCGTQYCSCQVYHKHKITWIKFVLFIIKKQIQFKIVFTRRSQIPNFGRQQFWDLGCGGNTTILNCITSVTHKTWNRVQPRYNKIHKIIEDLILTNTCLSLLKSVPVSKEQKWTDWQLHWHTFIVVRLLWFEVVIALSVQSAGVWQHIAGRQAPALP